MSVYLWQDKYDYITTTITEYTITLLLYIYLYSFMCYKWYLSIFLEGAWLLAYMEATCSKDQAA
jgi:hypothetical protein